MIEGGTDAMRLPALMLVCRFAAGVSGSCGSMSTSRCDNVRNGRSNGICADS